LESRGTRYDAHVIDVVEKLISQEFQFVISETLIAPIHLQEGMVLTRDVTHPDGYLLLSKDTVITRSVIDQLVAIDRDLKGKLRVYVARVPGADFS
jgi:hypothetical protein